MKSGRLAKLARQTSCLVGSVPDCLDSSFSLLPIALAVVQLAPGDNWTSANSILPAAESAAPWPFSAGKNPNLYLVKGNHFCHYYCEGFHISYTKKKKKRKNCWTEVLNLSLARKNSFRSLLRLFKLLNGNTRGKNRLHSSTYHTYLCSFSLRPWTHQGLSSNIVYSTVILSQPWPHRTASVGEGALGSLDICL